MTPKPGSARKAIIQKGSRQVQPTAAESPTDAKTTKKEGTKRITVDLPIQEHRQLKITTLDHDVDGIRIVRALLLQMHEDQDLLQKVLSRAERL